MSAAGKGRTGGTASMRYHPVPCWETPTAHRSAKIRWEAGLDPTMSEPPALCSGRTVAAHSERARAPPSRGIELERAKAHTLWAAESVNASLFGGLPLAALGGCKHESPGPLRPPWQCHRNRAALGGRPFLGRELPTLLAGRTGSATTGLVYTPRAHPAPLPISVPDPATSSRAGRAVCRPADYLL